MTTHPDFRIYPVLPDDPGYDIGHRWALVWPAWLSEHGWGLAAELRATLEEVLSFHDRIFSTPEGDELREARERRHYHDLTGRTYFHIEKARAELERWRDVADILAQKGIAIAETVAKDYFARPKEGGAK